MRAWKLLWAALGLFACAGPGTVADLRPGERPPPDTVEAGLWMQLERVEKSLRGSGRLERDPVLNAYVQSIVCRVAGPYCSDVRLYLVRTPHFNASMAPNGMMQVWTGLLLRAQNEDELAMVVSHEMAHYLKRHSLQLWRDLRSKADAMAFFQVMTAAAGVGFVGDLGQLVAVGTVFAFSRANEDEADEVGLVLMQEAGYDPRVGVGLWEGVLQEKRASGEKDGWIFFATHPAAEDRLDRLKARARNLAGPAAPTSPDRYWEAVLPHREEFLREEVRLRTFDGTLALLDRLERSGDRAGELWFFRGEVYRLRAGPGDGQRAVAAYEKALSLPAAPPEVHRSLGLALREGGNSREALRHFSLYLEAVPEAPDREMIRVYIAELE